MLASLAHVQVRVNVFKNEVQLVKRPCRRIGGSDYVQELNDASVLERPQDGDLAENPLRVNACREDVVDALHGDVGRDGGRPSRGAGLGVRRGPFVNCLGHLAVAAVAEVAEEVVPRAEAPAKNAIHMCEQRRKAPYTCVNKATRSV